MGRVIRRALTAGTILFLVAAGAPRALAQSSSSRAKEQATASQANFEPLQEWKDAVLAGDKAKLVTLYRADPPANLERHDGKVLTVQEEIAFWGGSERAGLTSATLKLAKFDAVIPRVVETAYRITLDFAASHRAEKRYASVWQYWVQEGGHWSIAESLRTGLTDGPQPDLLNEDLYPANGNAAAAIVSALARAAEEHRRVLLVFGANWCFLCHVLDAEFRLPRIARLLRANYEIVRVDLGEFNRNLDIAKRYNLLSKRGIPDLAILDGNGKLMFSQENVSATQAMWPFGPEGLLALLTPWGPKANRP